MLFNLGMMNNFIFVVTDLFINVEVLPESTIALTVQLSILQVVYETSLLSRPSQARLGLFSVLDIAASVDLQTLAQ